MIDGNIRYLTNIITEIRNKIQKFHYVIREEIENRGEHVEYIINDKGQNLGD